MGGGAGAQLGHGDEDDEEPRGDAHQPVGQRQRRVAQAQPRRGTGTLLRMGGCLQGLPPQKHPPQESEGTHGCCPHHDGGSQGAQEGGVTVTSTGLTQCPASAQHGGRQRRDTEPPSRAVLSPAPSAWQDLGTWGTRVVSGGGIGHPSHPPRGPRFRARRYLHFLDHFAKGPEEIPGQVPAELPCGDTSISSVGDTRVPSSYRATPQQRDPADPSTHWRRFRLGPETRSSPSPSPGGPKFGTHHKEPPRW